MSKETYKINVIEGLLTVSKGVPMTVMTGYMKEDFFLAAREVAENLT